MSQVAANPSGTIDRQLRLLRILASRRLGATGDDLSGELGISLKTICRDLNRFRDAAFPLTETIESHGRRRWRLDGDSVTGAGLGLDEAFALELAASSIGSVQRNSQTFHLSFQLILTRITIWQAVSESTEVRRSR